MPPKKIILTDSRQRSKERERSRTRRERETFDQTSQRREEQSLRQSALRERETLEQSSQRREDDALRHSSLRDRETLEQRHQRRQDDALRHSSLRDRETLDQRHQRRQDDALRHSSLRDRETTEEQLRRKELDAQRKTDTRERVTIEKLKGFLPTHNIARENSNVEQHYIGLMNEICHECQSMNFKDEKPSDGKFSSCCHKGKVMLDPLMTYPSMLKSLLTDKTNRNHTNFMENIRAYNSALGFASMGASIREPPRRGPYCFRIHGQTYHRVSPLHPPKGETPKYAQIYILDSEEALETRMAIDRNARCDRVLMDILGRKMKETNPFAKAYKMMHEVEKEEEQKAKKEGRAIQPICMFIRNDRRNDQRRYNAPRSNEVAIIFSDPNGEPPLERDIRIYSRSERKTMPISVLNPNCDPMVYPILFPNGEKGWDEEMKSEKQAIRNRITLFITITFNPEWPETKENLKPWQRSEYRPDLIARVFNLKLKELLKDIIERQILGVVVAFIYVI
jgi:hypothetical protein